MEENKNNTPQGNTNIEENLKDIAAKGAEMAGEAAKAGIKTAGKVAGTAAKAGGKMLLKPILIVAAIVIVGGGIFTGFKTDWFSKPLTIDKTANVVEEIKKIGEFTSQCYYEEMALRDIRIDTVERAGIFGIGAGKSFKENEIVLIGKGRVRAGFDLSAVEEGGIKVHGDTLELTLPQVKVFDIIMNPSDFTTEYESGTWSHELTKPIKERAKAQLEQNAIDNNILQKAEESGLKRLETLFKTFGFNTVLLTVEKSATMVEATPAEAAATEAAAATAETTSSDAA